MIGSTLNNTVLVLQSDCKKQVIAKNMEGARTLLPVLISPLIHTKNFH